MRTETTSKPRGRGAARPEPELPGTSAAAGIDVAKRSFEACYLERGGGRGSAGRFANDADGVGKFLRWLARASGGRQVHICMEETGPYGRRLAAALQGSAHRVSVANAALVKSFGASLNVRAKNDRVDAWLVARYTLDRVPPAWEPLPAAHAALRELARRRRQIKDLATSEKNHREAAAAAHPGVRESIARTTAALEDEAARLLAEMGETCASDEALSRDAALLRSLPGVGKITSLELLAELPPLASFRSARQLCAYAGLSPRRDTSGTSLRGRARLCKQGRAALRRLMFMPALSLLASKRPGPLREFAARLQERGKAKKCVVGALMRKLLALAFAVLRSGNPYDPDHHKQETA